jgi:hypothetical protein
MKNKRNEYNQLILLNYFIINIIDIYIIDL